ncbi:MAG: hypothetical protein ACK4FW_00235 [Stenotrophomonas sp.]
MFNQTRKRERSRWRPPSTDRDLHTVTTWLSLDTLSAMPCSD